MADVTITPKCANCGKTESEAGIDLKQCARCKIARYCSRDCQKADWKEHKRGCGSNAGSSTNTSPPTPTTAEQPLKGLSVTVGKPFHKLQAQKYLHDRPKQDVYKLLIDCYRLRAEDDYNLEGIAPADSIYGGAQDGQQGFRRFLRLAQGNEGLLPPWWSQENSAECEAVGTNAGWSSLASEIQKSDIMEHYGNPKMPMQLRILGEQVYGRGPGGQGGATAVQFGMMAETGEMESH